MKALRAHGLGHGLDAATVATVETSSSSSSSSLAVSADAGANSRSEGGNFTAMSAQIQNSDSQPKASVSEHSGNYTWFSFGSGSDRPVIP